MRLSFRLLRVMSCLAILALTFSGVGSSFAASPQPAGSGPETVQLLQHDESPPLSNIHPREPKDSGNHLVPLKGLLHRPSTQSDPVVQGSVTAPAQPTTGINVAGVGNGFTGPQGTFSVRYAPPDTNGAVGATQYVQWVNTYFAVFDKATGNPVYGPVPGNTLWSGFGGGCETNNDGDPIVQYDKAANRWLMTQFSVSTTPYLQCFAISTTSDAKGTWYRYALPMPNFPDYPKVGIWPDAYYMSFNMFSGNFFVGARACALDRSAMLVGATSTAICFQMGSNVDSLLPSDLDGAAAPPAGSPNFFLNLGSGSLNMWKFHVDFTTPSNSTFLGTTIPVAAFTEACNGGSCIPQLGTMQKLDSLGDRLMYRLAYRNFGDHESLVVNHSVTVGTSVGVRWYELRGLNTTPAVFQQGTYAPDSNFRWMGSIAIDQAGDIALGYSVSGTGMNPAIRYTGRTPADPLGTLTGENTIIQGTGSQTTNLNRWGDYSAMTIDPVDDCTFWYTNEYLPSDGTWNWSTRIANFKFDGCGTTPTPNFSLSASPASITIPTGGNANFSVSVTPTGGFANSVTITPTPTTGLTFTPSSATVDSPYSTSATFNVASSIPGSYSVTVNGTDGTLNRSTLVSVTVTSPTPTVGVASVAYSRSGGRNGTQNLSVTILLKDNLGTGNPVPNASVSMSLKLNGSLYRSASGTTGTSGTVTFSFNKAPCGTYATTVTNVSASGLTWSPTTTPSNSGGTC